MTIWRAACVLTMVLGLVAAWPAAAQDAPPMGYVFGYVVDPSGAPLAGATVVVLDSPDLATGAADDGSYLLMVPAGDRVLAAFAASFTSDQVFVSVPVDDYAYADVVAANPVAVPAQPDSGGRARSVRFLMPVAAAKATAVEMDGSASTRHPPPQRTGTTTPRKIRIVSSGTASPSVVIAVATCAAGDPLVLPSRFRTARSKPSVICQCTRSATVRRTVAAQPRTVSSGWFE